MTGRHAIAQCHRSVNLDSHMISDELLTSLICQHIEAQPSDDVHFIWQGHESLACFHRIAELQQRYAQEKRIYNTFQTNGMQLTEEGSRFFREHSWRVEVSIEGSSALAPTPKNLLQSLHSLKSHGVEFTLLVSIDQQNSQNPEQLYRHLRGLGTPYLQFIPRLEMNDHQPVERSIEAKVWGAFLCAVFDVWVREDVGRVFVQLFDSTLGVWNGFTTQICSLSEHCGHASGQFKKSQLAEACKSCSVLKLCNGDCPKHRDASGKSALCEGYRAFFQYSEPHMKVMRDLIRQRRSPMELMMMLRQQNQDGQMGC